MTMDNLHGILIGYEVRIEKDKEEKPSKKRKTKEHKSNDNSNSELDEEEVNFIRKLKRGSCKHKGKLPFKCFNCGEGGHFVAKFPHTKNKNSNKEEDSSFKNYKKGKTEKKRKFNRQNKNLYANEDNSSYDESDDDEMEVLFMGLELQDDVVDNENRNSENEDLDEEENPYLGEDENEETNG